MKKNSDYDPAMPLPMSIRRREAWISKQAVIELLAMIAAILGGVAAGLVMFGARYGA